jgi:hypothetical protein
MKKTFLFIAVLGSLSLSASIGQVAAPCGTAANPCVVTVDFLTKTITGDLSHKAGTWVRIEVENVNTYLYQVSLTGKDSVPAIGSVPPILRSFFSPDGLASMAAAIPAFSPLTEAIEAASAEEKKNSCAAKVERAFPAWHEAIQRHTVSWAASRTTLYRKLHVQRQALIERQRWVVNPTAALPAYDPAPVDSALAAFESEIRVHWNTLELRDQQQRRYVQDCQAYIKEDEKLRALQDQYIAYVEKAHRATYTLDTALYTQVNQLKADLLNLTRASFCYQSMPFRLNEPLRTVSVKIVPREGQPLNAYEQNLTFHQKAQPFVGFSTGFFYGRLKNQAFVSKPRPDTFTTRRNGNSVEVDTVSYRLVSEDTRPGEWGVVGLVHFGGKLREAVFLHGTTGLGLTVENKPQPRLLIGGGLAFGRNNKLVLTAGVEVGRINRLSNGYLNPEIPAYTPPVNFLKTETEGAFFFSVSYNFLNF